MSQRIGPGDTVQVVRVDHACATSLYGHIGIVHRIIDDGACRCPRCNAFLCGPTAMFPAGCGLPLHWLKRFPGLTDRAMLDEIADIAREEAAAA